VSAGARGHSKAASTITAWNNAGSRTRILLKPGKRRHAKGRVENRAQRSDRSTSRSNSTDPLDGKSTANGSSHQGPGIRYSATRRSARALAPARRPRRGTGAHLRADRDRELEIFVNNPPALCFERTRKWEFNLDKGKTNCWKKGRLEKRGTPDGIRGQGRQRKLKVSYSRTLDQRGRARRPRQSSKQRPVRKAGIEMELKSVTASVYFFPQMVANPDTYRPKFYLMCRCTIRNMAAPESRTVHAAGSYSWEVASEGQ